MKVKISKMTEKGCNSFRKAVRRELQRKALLGEFVIISRKGKTCRIPAKAALKE